MPNYQEIYCGHCKHCDYEWWCKSTKAEAMTKRLHKKKCKKEGRTKKPEWKSRLLAHHNFYQSYIKSDSKVFKEHLNTGL